MRVLSAASLAPLLPLLRLCASADLEVSGATSVRVLGQSGKITVTRDAAAITIDFDKLFEVDADGKTVGKKGGDKHSVTSFATQNFEFSAISDVDYQNISAKTFAFDTAVHDSIGKLAVQTYVFEGAGTVGTDLETWQVAPGDVKWNIELSDWSFCDPCQDGTAAYIDLYIEIKGKEEETSQVNGTADAALDMGSDTTLQLSSRVTVDGVETDMPAGYPRVESQGSKDVYVFRFPKFAQSALYDPLLQMSGSESDGAVVSAGATVGTTALWALAATLGLFWRI